MVVSKYAAVLWRFTSVFLDRSSSGPGVGSPYSVDGKESGS